MRRGGRLSGVGLWERSFPYKRDEFRHYRHTRYNHRGKGGRYFKYPRMNQTRRKNRLDRMDDIHAVEEFVRKYNTDPGKRNKLPKQERKVFPWASHLAVLGLSAASSLLSWTARLAKK